MRPAWTARNHRAGSSATRPSAPANCAWAAATAWTPSATASCFSRMPWSAPIGCRAGTAPQAWTSPAPIPTTCWATARRGPWAPVRASTCATGSAKTTTTRRGPTWTSRRNTVSTSAAGRLTGPGACSST
ncbi:hypothetical protein G6F56_013881 [Rhizopus delemar]|nr:hypothetical protein G6F56_013881 [Rhizopus delemar]